MTANVTYTAKQWSQTYESHIAYRLELIHYTCS